MTVESLAVLFAVAYIVMVRRPTNYGGTAADIGTFFAGISAFTATIVSLLNRRQLTHVQHRTDKTAESIGSPEGDSTVLELLREIRKFEEYQHGRNHDILAGITRLDVAIPLLIQVLEDYRQGR